MVKSPLHPSFDYPVLAADLAAFMEQTGSTKPTSSATPWGKTAMQLAFDHGHHIDKLVVVDICNKTYQGGHEEIFKAIREADVAHKEDRQVIFDF